jgi:hypothetical protein
LASSLVCRDLVRAKCEELEKLDIGLEKEIEAARDAADQKEINAFRLIL